jgi:nitrile hydratase subunit beta
VNSVHDLGGMHGFGRVPYEENEPVFHEEWEGRLYALLRAIKLPLTRNTDEGRYALEQLDPAVYLSSSYYERWLIRTEKKSVEKGVLTEDQLDEQVAFFKAHPDAPMPNTQDPNAVELALGRVYRRPSMERSQVSAPRFKVGDPVLTRNFHPKGHTRLPRYARDKRGVISAVRGTYDLADAVAVGLPPDAQPVYSVRFEGRTLWGESAEPGACVYIDLWECYLLPEPSTSSSQEAKP